MRRYAADTPLDRIARVQQYQAKLAGSYHGLIEEQPILDACRFMISPLGILGIFTFDTGMHSSGWWKNPDYESCWHLSISFHDPRTMESRPHDDEWSNELVQAFFGEYSRLAWSEPPYTKQGKEDEVWHYRLFVDAETKVPILPRGEVYTREFTEKGWKSFSEVRGQKESEEREKQGGSVS